MIIHVVSALEQLLEILKTNGQANGQTNGGPQGVTSSHPIPEAKHVFAVNTKGGNLLLVGGQGHKVLGHSGGLKI